MQYIAAVDPLTEWYAGPFGFVLRLRWIWSIFGTKIVAAAVAFAADFAELAFGITALAVGCAGIALVIRHYRLQKINSCDSLHKICHHTRDDLASILQATTAADYDGKIDVFHKQLAERIADYFRKLIGDDSINCAIRLAEDRGGTECYVTRARSVGMEAARAPESVPIPANRGLANALRQKDSRGVYVVPDIHKAIEAGVWMETPNDKLPDVKTLMVAPINGWEKADKSMLGILYVTSRSHAFLPMDTLPMKAIADLLGLAYPLLIKHGTSLH